MPADLARLAARSGHARQAHLVGLSGAPEDPLWKRTARKSLCSFRPQRGWGSATAPQWMPTCTACAARAERDGLTIATAL